MPQKERKAVVLLSGGLDSATTLYVARARGYAVSALIIDYGQRHRREIRHAEAIARQAAVPFQRLRITLPWQGSSLLDRRQPLPEHRTQMPQDIPTTYVPARNIIFCSLAASYAEAIGGRAIFIGANAIDYSGYPDCRPAFYAAYQQALAEGLKAGVEQRPVKIHTPLIRKTKAQIIRLACRLDVPLAMTWSCYRGGRRPCGRCDSCLLRQKGFETAGLADPALDPDAR